MQLVSFIEIQFEVHDIALSIQVKYMVYQRKRP